MQESSNERWATLVLVTPAGELLGQLPELRAGSPWWPEVESVVRAARESQGLGLVILRLLASERPAPHAGRVVYLAEVDPGSVSLARARCEPCTLAADVSLADHPLRNGYARLGGPARDLAWAEAVLAQHGLALAGAPRQVKTWNLSSLWCLPIAGGQVWLKVVPPFFAHEGALIAALPPGARVPRLLGHAGPRCLMADIPGEDLFHADQTTQLAMIELLVALQQTFCGRSDELLALGLPDRRAAALRGSIRSLLDRSRSELDAADTALLDGFVCSFERRCAALAECGLPDGLVHGDFHPGNVRGHGANLTLIDWSDASVGHPWLDTPAFLSRSPEPRRAALRAHWVSLWRSALPGSDPERAWGLAAPLAAARQAVTYRQFLDQIEPSEHAYHRGDPADWLRRTAALLRDERADSF